MVKDCAAGFPGSAEDGVGWHDDFWGVSYC